MKYGGFYTLKFFHSAALLFCTCNRCVAKEKATCCPNFKGAQHLTFAKELPLIVDAGNTSNEGWIPLHEEQAKNSLQGKMMTFEGGHYLHHFRSKEIAENFIQIMQEVK